MLLELCLELFQWDSELFFHTQACYLDNWTFIRWLWRIKVGIESPPVPKCPGQRQEQANDFAHRKDQRGWWSSQWWVPGEFLHCKEWRHLPRAQGDVSDHLWAKNYCRCFKTRNELPAKGLSDAASSLAWASASKALRFPILNLKLWNVWSSLLRTNCTTCTAQGARPLGRCWGGQRTSPRRAPHFRRPPSAAWSPPGGVGWSRWCRRLRLYKSPTPCHLLLCWSFCQPWIRNTDIQHDYLESLPPPLRIQAALLFSLQVQLPTLSTPQPEVFSSQNVSKELLRQYQQLLLPLVPKSLMDWIVNLLHHHCAVDDSHSLPMVC